MSDRLLIVDFGSQVTQLIARRVREAGVYCEIHPFQSVDAAKIAQFDPRGIFVADDAHVLVVGFGSCGPVRDPPDGLNGTEQRVGEVYTLYVESDFQNQGLGRRLLDAMFRQLHADGFDTAVLWMLARNSTRFFYEGLGGDVVGQRTDHMGGEPVDEVAYAWRDLDAPLVRRRLAPEEEG